LARTCRRSDGMIMSRFRSMGLAAGAAASVLSCYMVSLRVARERGEVQRIEQQIADAHRDIRDLKTELGTRGRMRQLERWNSDVLALSAPGAAQYLNGSVELASYQPAPVEAAPAIAAAAVTSTTVTTAAAQPAVAKAIPAVEVTPATHDAPKLMTASYKPKATKKKASDSGPVRIASAKSKTSAKSKASSDKQVRLASAKAKANTKSKTSSGNQVRLASAKTKTTAKSKAADAKLLRTASFKAKASKSGGPNAGLIHTASYVTTRKIGPTRVALLDDDVLHDIGRAAAHEGKTGRKAAQ
jgi:hypothetical protein